MKANKKPDAKAAALVGVQDALVLEIEPMLAALHRLALCCGALREVAAVCESEPELQRRIAMGGVDLADLLDQPEKDLAELAFAIRMRVRALQT